MEPKKEQEIVDMGLRTATISSMAAPGDSTAGAGGRALAVAGRALAAAIVRAAADPSDGYRARVRADDDFEFSE